MFKLVVGVAVPLFCSLLGWLMWRQRVAAGREMFAHMSSGQVCFHCDSRDVTPSSGGIRCATCGEETPRALIEGGGSLEPGLLEEMTVDPNDSRPWYAR